MLSKDWSHAGPGGRGPATAENRNEAVLFQALLQPNRSLSPRGFRYLMGFVIASVVLSGTGFMLAGAWPVLGFLGLDVALVYFAFRLSYRSGSGYETVQVTADDLIVTKVSHWGTRSCTRFQPYWLRVSFDRSENAEGRLILSSHGRSVVLGEFLAPGEREELALALQATLLPLQDPAGASLL
ncbi:DUF2244 domain-containing protein [Kiloniella laminariae]|uniref:DUF2244 domain-containing protein n=1 Tax=Kiloniella laminariae TaxID=454162 RepID=A0ABT4LIR3_9PROT|nr:DUF2244 domain-containing protein [Kiloniella laminariae]MCZ4280967.1 DUF2244 domain-containing protein [Kiloniella laminariae]